jgi:hypothetical protein
MLKYGNNWNRKSFAPQAIHFPVGTAMLYASVCSHELSPQNVWQVVDDSAPPFEDKTSNWIR